MARTVDRWWTDARIARLVDSPRCLVAGDCRDALLSAANRHLIDSAKRGRAIAERHFSILGFPVPVDGPLPWHSDWRFGHSWPPAYFRSYDFYEANRAVPYDVKYPWELSRLAFLLPMMQDALLTEEDVLARAALSIVDDWSANNPLAFSVNWDPMEASMRGVNLLLLFELLLKAGQDGRQLRQLIVLLTTHGEFVARTLEFTDVRGNHYAANAVCLFLLGLALRRVYPPAGLWAESGRRLVTREIELQILPDGVDFEKSVSYHRLVAELFLLAAIGARRVDGDLPEQTLGLVRAAVGFTAVYTRSNGWTPNLGDNDDAHVLQFDGLPSRDHRPLAALGAAFFKESSLKPPGFFSSSIPILIGGAGVCDFVSLPDPPEDRAVHFSSGGIVVVRSASNLLFVDVGEVGLAGRGGHGHNDLLSFELVLAGLPLIVDSGSYMYTGDLASRRWFQSTVAHNGLQVDGEEISPILGTWRIGNNATPRNVSVSRSEAGTKIRASHDGYRVLSDPVLHTREICFDASSGHFSCTDRIEAAAVHNVERFLHFPPGARVSVSDRTGKVVIEGRSFHLQWKEPGAGKLEEGWWSPSYGVRYRAPFIVLTNQSRGVWESTLTISTVPERGDERTIVSASLMK